MLTRGIVQGDLDDLGDALDAGFAGIRIQYAQDGRGSDLRLLSTIRHHRPSTPPISAVPPEY
jgi:hypothetical protein